MRVVSCSLLQKEKDSPDEELHALKRENKLLREKNAAVNRKKEHYECEIKRLNQVGAGRAGRPEGRVRINSTPGGGRGWPCGLGARPAGAGAAPGSCASLPPVRFRLWEFTPLQKLMMEKKGGEIIGESKNGLFWGLKSSIKQAGVCEK